MEEDEEKHLGEVGGGGGWKASVWSEAMNHELPRAAEVEIGNGAHN